MDAAAPWLLLLLVAVTLFCQVGVYYLQAWQCKLAFESSQAYKDPESLTILVVTDVHVLGTRRRAWVDRLWVDWQIYASARAAVDVHDPTLVLVLGDQVDEGGRRTPRSDWDTYVARFFRACSSFLPRKTLYLVRTRGRHVLLGRTDTWVVDLLTWLVVFHCFGGGCCVGW